MDWLGILLEGLLGSLDILARLLLIMVPLIIALEIVRESGYLERISNKISFIAGFFSAGKRLSFPIAVGGIFGLTNACAVLIEHRRDKSFNKKESKQAAEIVGINHGWIDDTMLFVIVGANFFVVFFARIVIAAVVEKAISLYKRLGR